MLEADSHIEGPNGTGWTNPKNMRNAGGTMQDVASTENPLRKGLQRIVYISNILSIYIEIKVYSQLTNTGPMVEP